jgi:hypothetical protein
VGSINAHNILRISEHTYVHTRPMPAMPPLLTDPYTAPQLPFIPYFKCQVTWSEDGNWTSEADSMVLPHPDNFTQLYAALGEILEIVQGAALAHGPLCYRDNVNDYTFRISLLRSFPGTKHLHTTPAQALYKAFVTPEAKGKGATQGSLYERAHDFAFPFPTDLQDYLGSSTHLRDSVKAYQRTSHADLKELGVKDPTPAQPAHTDGRTRISTQDPIFASLLLALGETAHLCIWPYSHDMTELLRQSRSDCSDPAVTQDPDTDDETFDAKVTACAEHQAPPGSLIEDAGTLRPEIVPIRSGESILFLHTLVHAGTALHDSAYSMHYRLHCYIVRKQESFREGSAHCPSKLLRERCLLAEGGDSYL